MKTLIAFTFALLCTALVTAADITLRDGRVLSGAVVLKQDAGTITVRHSGGFTQVEKTKLPDDLAAQYPIDDTALAQQRASELAGIAQRTREQALKREQRNAAAAARKAQPRTAEQVQNDNIREAVGVYIQRKYGRMVPSGVNRWTSHTPYPKLDDPTPVPGTIDQWTVGGTVEISGSETISVAATVAQIRGAPRVIQFEAR